MRKIDLETWPRRDVFAFYSQGSSPFFSVTFDMDVTEAYAFARDRGVSFYCVMVWLVTRAVNRTPALCQKIVSGEVWQLDGRVPSFTDLRPGAEQYHIVTLPLEGGAEDFARKAKAKSMAQDCFLDPSEEGPDLLYISAMPWVRMTGYSDARRDPDDCIPRLSWGRWEERNGRRILWICLGANHRTVDGLHIGRFAEALEEEIRLLAT